MNNFHSIADFSVKLKYVCAMLISLSVINLLVLQNQNYTKFFHSNMITIAYAVNSYFPSVDEVFLSNKRVWLRCHCASEIIL